MSTFVVYDFRIPSYKKHRVLARSYQAFHHKRHIWVLTNRIKNYQIFSFLKSEPQKIVHRLAAPPFIYFCFGKLSLRPTILLNTFSCLVSLTKYPHLTNWKRSEGFASASIGSTLALLYTVMEFLLR